MLTAFGSSIVPGRTLLVPLETGAFLPTLLSGLFPLRLLLDRLGALRRPRLRLELPRVRVAELALCPFAPLRLWVLGLPAPLF
jgi:hypothetical protein